MKIWNAIASSLPGHKVTPNLSYDAILSRQKKLKDANFGTGAAFTGLKKLIDSIEDTGDLHPFGKFYVGALVKSLLLNKQKLATLWNNRPDILYERIERPVIILGLPRSGTSFLFNLLAQDPAHRFLSNWEATVSQVPPEGTYTYLRDPRRRKGRYLMRLQNYLVPHLGNIHEFYLDGPEECTPILMQEFTTQALAGMFRVPDYSQWLNHAPRIETYAHHKRVLQTLQWKYPGDRWLLKSPDHMAAISEILEVYPDACIIHLHRDPVKSVTSWSSLNAAFRGIYTKTIDMHELGAEITDRLTADVSLYMEKRKTLPSVQFIDVLFADLVRDPIMLVRHAYHHFNLSLSDEAERKMVGFISRNKAKENKHQYQSAEFGINRHSIESKFINYTKAFHVPLER